MVNEILLTIALVKWLNVPFPIAVVCIFYTAIVEVVSLGMEVSRQYLLQQKHLNFENIDETLDKIIKEGEK